MEDRKTMTPELLRLRRTMELREFVLAASYPQTHSGIAHRQLTEDGLRVATLQPPQSRLPDNPDSRESGAKPWKKPWDK
jgi:hypothetical protein